MTTMLVRYKKSGTEAHSAGFNMHALSEVIISVAMPYKEDPC